MLDINLIREKTDFVCDGLKKRDMDVDFRELLEWDKNRRVMISESDQLKALRNRVSSEIPKLKKAGEDVSEKLKEMKKTSDDIK